MIMQLPSLAPDYSWRVETFLNDEKLARNEARVRIVHTNPNRLAWWRARTVAEKTFTYKSAEKRDQKFEKAAKKLADKLQTLAYSQHQERFARYLADENLKRELINQ